MSAINEIVTRFSFVGSLDPQTSFNQNLGSSIKLLAGVSTAIVGAAAGFTAWTISVTEAIDPMVQLSRETGTSIAAIQELGFAASQNGSDLNAVQSSIRELTKRAGEFARTGGGQASEAFLQMGLSVRDANGNMKTADVIMNDLSGTMQSFNKGEQADILDKLGIDPSMIQLLNESSSEMKSLREEARSLGVITKEQADAAASLNDANTTLKFGLTGLKNSIAVGLAPTIQGIIEKFIGFLKANKDLIVNGITKLADGIMVLSGFIKRIAPVVGIAVAVFGAWALATGGLTAIMGVLMSPVVLITAAIVAIVLVIDDLIVAFNGGNSVIGTFIKQITGFDIGPAMRNAVASIGEFVSLAIDGFKELYAFITDFSFDGVWDGLLESFMAAFKTIKDTFSGWIDSATFGLFSDDDKPAGFQGGNSGAIDKGVTNNSSSNSSVNQNNNINVYSSDPQAAGRAVSAQQSNSLRETRQYFNRGGM